MKYKYLFPLLLIMTGCTGFWPFAERDDFVSVRATQFIHNNQPYYFVGTNLWYACYLGSPGISGNRPRLIRELDSLQSIGITNLRLLAGSELSTMNRTLKPSITPYPGKNDDSLLLGLDFTLSELSKRKMKAVLFLTNYWEWSGGMAQYVLWADSMPTFNHDGNGWNSFMNFSASFYKNEKANMLFRSYIAKVIARKNAYNGRSYYEDPTIMSWQLANEPRPGTISPYGYENVPYFLRWIDETARYIKTLDTNHLVSTGSEGIIGSLQNEEYYLSAHSSKHIDYMTIHLWPSIWKWMDPLDQEETFPASVDSTLQYIARSLYCARSAQKPLVLEEFGLGRDNGANGREIPTTLRDRFFKLIFEVMYDSALAGAPIAGCNFWAWGGEGSTENSDFMWREGDSFTGDPPHEPQGMHSVFNTDHSTIAIIREFANKITHLRTVDSLRYRISL